MNDSSIRPVAGRSRPIRAAALLALAGLGAGCENPFVTSLSDLGLQPPPERTLVVQPFNEQQFSTPTRPEDELREARKDPFAGVEKAEITLEQARAYTLENNLDLDVVLIDPVIANESLSEEEGRFESVFFTRARYNNLDSPTATALEGSQVQDLSVDPGVRIPLRTGGTATVSLPLNRNETNNAFSTLNPSYGSDGQFSISQPLLRGAGRRANTHGVRLASLNKQISLARTKLEVIRQLAAVERSYWRLYAFQRALEVRQMQYELAEEQRKRAARRVTAGNAAEIENVRAEAGVAERLEAILIAENDVREAQREFKRIVNVPGLGVETATLITAGTAPDPVKFVFDPTALTEQALANRMEMLELELRLAQDESQIDFERNQALPLFSVDYTYRINGLGASFQDSFKQLEEHNFQDHIFGLSAEIPLGNVQEDARVQRAILTRLQRLSTREARKQSIQQEVLNAVDNVEAGWQRILAARQSTVANARTFQGEQRQYDVGARTSTDVLDASTRLADSQLAEIRALAEYQISLVDLAFASGTLLGASRVSWAPIDPREGDKPEPNLIMGRHPVIEEHSAETEAIPENAKPMLEPAPAEAAPANVSDAQPAPAGAEAPAPNPPAAPATTP